MTKDSKVQDREALYNEANRFINLFGSVLVEEFIEGSECTVLVTENPGKPNDPIIWTPAQYKFPEGEDFKHFDLKWVDFQDLSS